MGVFWDGAKKHPYFLKKFILFTSFDKKTNQTYVIIPIKFKNIF